MTACKKDDAKVTFEGNQWITETFAADGDMPEGKYLLDVGAKSGAGKASALYLVTESNAVFAEGSMILLSAESYVYDSATGKFTFSNEEYIVEFITDKKIKYTAEGMSFVFSLVEGKQYSIKDAIPLEGNPGEFEITPSKGSDWAGGYVTFDASHSVRYMTYDALTEGVEADRNFSTKLENNTLTLGLYKDAEGNIADCDILIRATDYDGKETSCTVRSKAWKPAVYTENNGSYTEYDLSQGWSRATECWLGAVNTTGEIAYDGVTNSFAGISYEVPSFMSHVGSSDNKVCFDTPNTNQSGKVRFAYGDLYYELTLDINR